ncbi:PLP-dependent transferase [Piromyces finnis]|uniref:PLP-dependent transferase n=1 Tax=Piromyces finnis TaxID=1754191 RepID=A0A1Y1VAV4_9FUNG|nr:PLP-dependent transferase [Piromyces finnis]|eukprot:ORX51492.1 PLP-dependent transferase [Piromyces finnis]
MTIKVLEPKSISSKKRDYYTVHENAIDAIPNAKKLKLSDNSINVKTSEKSFKVIPNEKSHKKATIKNTFNGSKLSDRALEIQKDEFFLSKGMTIVRNNKYHPEINPNGIINLGTAENKLNNVELLGRINEASAVTAEQLLYGPNPGSDRLREEISMLLNRHFNPKVSLNKENICVGNGCGPLLNLYGQVLFDSGDAVLVPGPYYGGFHADINYGSRVYTISVPHCEDDCLKVDEAALEKALKESTRPVKGIIIANPNNPFGRCYSAEQLLLFCNFAKSHGLVVICDEIYGLSTWKEITEQNIEKGKTIEDYYCHCDRCKSCKEVTRIRTSIDGKLCKYTPIFSLDLPDPENTHGLWGFSKDFCLNGLRIGVTISYSKTVMDSLQKISFLTCIPTNIDNILVHMLSDHKWTDNFIINNNRKLFKNYTHLVSSLKVHNIPYIKGNAGFFIYIDLHQAGLNEFDLWMKLLEGGVYISPSQAFFSADTESERNWFRVCFAVEQNELNLSLDRLYKVLNTIKK